MALQGGSPIAGRATIKAVDRNLEDAAEAREDSESRAALDEEELRELEQAQYANVAAAAHLAPAAPPVARRRSILDRLLLR